MAINHIEILENCRFCLMCRHVAPLAVVTDMETLTPHGIALIATSVQRGLIEWNSETVDVIYSEPDDGNCRAHCVFDQPHHEAVAAVRAELVEQNLAPRIVYEVQAALEKWGTPFAEVPAEAASGTGDVALFIGDEAKYLWPETVSAVQKLVTTAEGGPVIIGNGRSSGLLATSLGLRATAVNQAEAILAELKASGAKTLLVLSPGDYFSFNQAFSERLDIDFPADVELVEVTTWLAQQVKAGNINFNAAGHGDDVAYVDPTHAVRVPGREDAVRGLVTAVTGTTPRELFWRRDRAQPVGSTYLQFSQPELADKLTHARLKDAQNSGAKTIISEDPGTLYHLNQYAVEYGLQVQGLYELLAENLE